MKWFRKYGTRREEIKRAKKEFYTRVTIIGIIIGFFAFAILLAQVQKIGKSTNSESHLKSDRSSEETLAFQEKLREEFALVQMEINNAPEETHTSEKYHALLTEAIELQEQIISNRVSQIAARADTETLQELKKKYDKALSEVLNTDSIIAEQKAEELFKMGQYTSAIEKLELAHEKQLEIDRDYSRSPYRNASRANQLKNKISLWYTKPKADRVDELIANSKTLLSKDDVKQAISLAEAAVEIQKDLNLNYRSSVYASLGRLKNAETNLIDAIMTEPLNKLNQLSDEAESAYQAKDIELAEARIVEAIATATRFAIKYPSQKTQLEQIKEKFAIRKDTITSYPLSQSIETLNQRLVNNLKAGNGKEAEVILPDLFRQLDRMRTFYPRSELLNKELYNRINKLNMLRNSISRLMNFLSTNLKELEGYSDRKLLVTEVPQSLLEILSIQNPSLAKSPNYPVDSISAKEAEEITKVISWIVQSEVRLPTKSEFVAALGNPEEIRNMSRSSWSSQNSKGETNAVATSTANNKGFFDLLGNVSEWVTNPDGEYITIGGSARDNPIRLAEVPEIQRQENERNRFVGFRFIVLSSNE